jgi:TolA-binding protein
MKKALLAIVILLSLIVSGVAEARTVAGWTRKTTRRALRRKKILGRREVERLYKQAEEYFLNDNYQEAIGKLESIVSHFPRSRYADDALFLIGLSYLKEKDWQEARGNFRKLLGEYHDSNLLAEAQIGLADSSYLAGDINQAISGYRQFLIDNPQGPLLAEVYLKLGRCYQKKGRWDEARYYFKRVCADYPLSFEAVEASSMLGNDKLYFTVQVGSFVDRRNALSTCKKLENRGYQAYLSEVKKEGRLLYRVRVGRFESRGEADYIAGQLRKRGYSPEIYP